MKIDDIAHLKFTFDKGIIRDLNRGKIEVREILTSKVFSFRG